MFQLCYLNNQQQKSMLLEGIKIRKTLFILNDNLNNFVLYLEDKLLNHKNWILCFGTGQNYQLNYLIQQSLKSMTFSQNLSYYLGTIYFIKQFQQFPLKNHNSEEKNIYEKISMQIKINYKGWQNGICFFNSSKLVFNYENGKFQAIQLQLKNFFVRISKNRKKKVIVLMPINQSYKNIIRLCFKIQQNYNYFLNCYQNSYKNYVYENIKKGYFQSNHAEIHLKFNQKADQDYKSLKKTFQKINLTQNQAHIFTYLKKRHILNPYQKEFDKDQSKAIVLWGKDWIMRQNGEIIFNNQEVLERQRSVIKQIIKKIILNISKGKSIFSTSLPVIIFGNSSLTQKICKCLGYAPLALQNTTTYLDKIKGVLIMTIGISILFLQDMDKPFNSIIGETFQGLIDGCPVYAQQISHHPPITSFFMKGRGYYIYGSIEPRAQLGFNKVKGWNEGVVSVSFNQNDYTQDVIQFNFPFTQLSGLIFGSRGIKRIDCSYIYDKQNLILCKLNWGKNSKIQNKISKMESYMFGKVVKIKNSLQNINREFLKEDQKNFNQVLWNIQGNWTQKIYINKELVFDFQQNMPFECIESELVLLSHSNLRKDIIEKRAGNIQQSQIEKDILQNIQRKDKKLRQSNF